MNLILGGTHGLGREIAKELQHRGEETFVVGRSYREVEDGAGMAADLSKGDDIEKLVAYINQHLGDDALKRFFWVAGYGYIGDFATQPEPQKMAQINFANVIPIAQAIWQQLLETEAETNFVVIGSTTGIKARKDEAVYAATKHAQVGFTRSLGLESEHLDCRVRVALFLPGGMQTPFWDGSQPPTFTEFLDPIKVASQICEKVITQTKPFYEKIIERGSL